LEDPTVGEEYPPVSEVGFW